MGNNGSSTEKPLSTEDLLKKTNCTKAGVLRLPFTPAFAWLNQPLTLYLSVADDDLAFLSEKYAELSGSITKDGLIDMAEFQASLGFKEATTAARLFNCLDRTTPFA